MKKKDTYITNFEVILWICIVVILFGLVRLTMSNIHKKPQLETEYQEKVLLKEKRKKENKEINKLNRQNQIDPMSEASVERANDFFDKYFIWNSWKEYSNNMKLLRKDFSNVEKEHVVDISGMDVGSGNSPSSSYSKDADYVIDDGLVMSTYTQTKNFDAEVTTTKWLAIYKSQGKSLDIKKIYQFSEQ